MIWWLLTVATFIATLRTPNGLPRKAMGLVFLLCLVIAAYNTSRKAE